ncbi:MAG: RNA polymerase sigma factor [candidate division Zixibacteria bacterium]|nr:RNA polymerase sigma factor [candidate division Zixibacteria bacterium]
MEINTLYKKACNGDKSSEDEFFHVLTVRFRLFLYQKGVNEEDAKEIVQDAMLTIIEEYKKIVFKTSFSAWAYNVLQNKLLNYYRKSKRRGETVSSTFENHINQYETWDSDPDLAPQLLDCLRKIGKTNTRYARILNLHFQGYKVEEICEKLDITSSNLYVILSRARSMLSSCLEKGGFD